jgi:hypothetical protein
VIEQPIRVEQMKLWVPQLFYLRPRIEPNSHFSLLLEVSVKQTHPLLSSSSSRQNTSLTPTSSTLKYIDMQLHFWKSHGTWSQASLIFPLLLHLAENPFLLVPTLWFHLLQNLVKDCNTWRLSSLCKPSIVVLILVLLIWQGKKLNLQFLMKTSLIQSL